jgi:hypothetical protein
MRTVRLSRDPEIAIEQIAEAVVTGMTGPVPGEPLQMWALRAAMRMYIKAAALPMPSDSTLDEVIRDTAQWHDIAITDTQPLAGAP